MKKLAVMFLMMLIGLMTTLTVSANGDDVCGTGQFSVAVFNRSGEPVGDGHPGYDVTLTNFTETQIDEDTPPCCGGEFGDWDYSFYWQSENSITRIVADIAWIEEGFPGPAHGLNNLNATGTSGQVNLSLFDFTDEPGMTNFFHVNSFTFCDKRSNGGSNGGGDPHGVPEFSLLTLAIAITIAGLGLAVLRKQH